MTKTKLTACEKRVQKYCDSIKQYLFDGADIAVEWKRSKMYGHNPVIQSHDGKLCNVSGCGYCKLSTALADVLCFLFPVDSEAFNAVRSTGGAGVNSVESALAKHGWNLDRTASGKTFDGFKLSRIPD